VLFNKWLIKFNNVSITNYVKEQPEYIARMEARRNALVPVAIKDINSPAIIFQFKSLDEGGLFLGVDESLLLAADRNGSIIHSITGARPGSYRVTLNVRSSIEE